MGNQLTAADIPTCDPAKLASALRRAFDAANWAAETSVELQLSAALLAVVEECEAILDGCRDDSGMVAEEQSRIARVCLRTAATRFVAGGGRLELP